MLDPAHVAHAEGAAGHHVEAVLVEPGEGEVGFDAAALVAQLRVDERALRLVEVVGGQPLQGGEGAGPVISYFENEPGRSARRAFCAARHSLPTGPNQLGRLSKDGLSIASVPAGANQLGRSQPKREPNTAFLPLSTG